MLTIHSKKRILHATVCALVALVAGSSLLTIIKNIKSNADAATANEITANGAPVLVEQGYDINYGVGDYGPNGDQHVTRHYHIYTQGLDGPKVTGFCGNASMKGVSGEKVAVRDPAMGADAPSDSSELIRYIIYLQQLQNPVVDMPVYQRVFGWIGTDTDEQYAMAHATVSYLYMNDTKGLTSELLAGVQSSVAELRALRDARDVTWLISKNYVLYGIEGGGDTQQNIFWVEDNSQFGDITVKKCDSELNECTAQGGASLAGITFNVYNNAGGRIAYNNQVIATYNPAAGADNSAAIIASGQTDQNGQVTFADLPIGAYIVEETGTNNSYTLSGEKQNVTLTTDGATLTFNNDVKKGDLIINKHDKELGVCDTLGSATFSGVTFAVRNASGKPIVYGSETIASGDVVTTVALGVETCTQTISGLPYGTYTVEEAQGGDGYLKSTESFTVNVPPESGAPVEVTFTNQVVRGDILLRKVNRQTGEAMANIPFRITSKTTGESHIVVTDQNGVIETSSLTNSNSTNGYDNLGLANITYQGFGVWFGKGRSGEHTATAVNTLGALPYDTYEIAELNCTANSHCIVDGTSKKTFTISENDTVIDLGTWENNCPEYHIETLASDGADGDKFIEARSGAKIRDNITYCAVAGESYTIKGVLMDKSTGAPLLVNGNRVEASKAVTPEGNCNATELVFDLDTSSILGKTIVVFEYLYQGDEEKAAHTEINDVDQSVYVIGVSTTATDKADGDKELAANSDVTIHDEVDYCLVAGYQFKLHGVVMNKTTKQPVEVNGATLEKSVTVTPTENCGQVVMDYALNTTGLAETDLVVFEDVYYIGEDGDNDNPILTNHDYNNTDETVSVAPAPIPEPEPEYSIRTVAADNEDGDKFVEAKSNTKIKDTVNYCAVAGESYTIKGVLMDKSTGAPLLVNGNRVEASKTVTAQENCNTTELTFSVDTSALLGKTVVVFESLYAGNEEKASHENINDPDQTVFVIGVSTTATDKADGDKELAANSDVTIHDEVNYCLAAGHDFRIRGIVMDKATRQPVQVNGQPLEETVDVTLTENCGKVVMDYDLNTSGLAEAELVVFEEVYLTDAGASDEPILTNYDYDNADETVSVAPAPIPEPEPEYSLRTMAVDDKDNDKFVEASRDAKVKDVVKYCVENGKRYLIKGVLMDKATGKPLEIGGKTVEASKTIMPSSNCGTISLAFDVDASELNGKTIVAFEYLYAESNPDEPITSHTDINDRDQSVYIIGVDTFAKDLADGDKLLAINSDVEIHDTVKYCLVAGTKFTIRGVVMDKTAKEPVLVDGKPLEQSITITPEETCGELEMVYSLNTTGMSGAELVVFEEVYLGTSDKGTPILTNYDYENEAETVAVIPDTPDTGFGLGGGGKGAAQGITPVVFLALGGASIFGGYGLMRFSARRRFLRGRR